MVLIIHGFPNEISALRFEWAWQNPEQSLRLKHLVPKTKHYNFIFKFNVVAEMLRIGPWCRLPLTIRWLKQEYEQQFNINKMPPAHMPIVYGPVKIVKKPSKQQQQKKAIEVQATQSTSQSKNCFLCKTLTNDSNRIKCIKCHVDTHMTCLSKVFLNKETDQMMPIEGDCPRCTQCFLWGDLMRFRLGCYTDLDMSVINYDTDDNENENDDVIEEIDSD
jgi:structure-specific endonuclease subunit SLX1